MIPFSEPRITQGAFCNTLIAKTATGHAVYAFVGFSAFPHKDQAFQASSPKTFKGPAEQSTGPSFM
jgi:hypothetical protein